MHNNYATEKNNCAYDNEYFQQLEVNFDQLWQKN